MLLTLNRGRWCVRMAGSALVSATAAACAHAPPARVGGAPSAPASPSTTWSPGREATAPLRGLDPHVTDALPIPSEMAPRAQTLALTDVVALALGNSPLTRVSWLQARAAAATLGAARGQYFPTVEGTVNGGPSQVVSANPARLPASRTTFTPSLSMQYLLFDFGGRGGSTAAAREALYAADFTHNASVQSVVLQAEQAYFTYQANRGLLVAAQATVQTAQANLEAAEQRHEVGLATIADVLQARTALAQAQLDAQTADGAVQAARASIALAMGLDANGPFEVARDSGMVPVGSISESVDSLIARAVRDRPDLAAARASVRASEAEVRVARSATRPSLSFGATTGRSFSNNDALEGRTYGLTFGFSVPLFSGLSHQYDVVAAEQNADAALARAKQLQLETAAQVFTSYHVLRTATQRVATSGDLLASATRSEEVARGRYAEGVGSILDLLTAQNALADARAQSVTARWSWYAALAQLARDAGALSPRGEAGIARSDSSGRTR